MKLWNRKRSESDIVVYQALIQGGEGIEIIARQKYQSQHVGYAGSPELVGLASRWLRPGVPSQ